MPLLALGCASEDPQLVRKGGPLPEASGGAGDTGPLVPVCDAMAVIHARCSQRCHSDPPQNGAPVPFLTYADTQAQYYTTDMKFSDVMLPAVQKDFMPYQGLNGPPTNLMPPIEPLAADEKATLVNWLKQGALPTGGTDCP
ncbi:MAG TPA: hypothetical protein VNG33_22235 [Polyangiaceae bacterium]|nr:hypothetical protein [Polyangiaceae bacterium]